MSPLYFRPGYNLQQISDSMEFPASVFEQYTAEQMQALMLGFRLVADPLLMARSECMHRAVIATMFRHLGESFPMEAAAQLNAMLLHRGIQAEVVRIGDSYYLYAFGYNGWPDGVDSLNCKPGTGMPWDVSIESLAWREYAQVDMVTPAHVDQFCPMRTVGQQCTVVHAEEVALSTFISIHQMFDLDLPSELNGQTSFLCCTWVPCINCIKLLMQHRDLLGGSRVFSLAGSDEDDADNAALVRGLFADEALYSYQGPYISVPKSPGYGWTGLTDVERMHAELRQMNRYGSRDIAIILPLLKQIYSHLATES